MRILCVTDEHPWPERTGSRMRVANVMRALAGVGTLDVLALVSDGRTLADCPVPDDVEIAELRVLNVEPAVRTPAGLRRWLRGPLPRRIAWRDWSAARVALGDLLRARGGQPYDLVWWVRADIWAALHDLVDAPSIVDLDNLEDGRLVGRRAVLTGDGVPLRARVSGLLDSVDGRRWHALQQRAAAHSARVLVCSELDRGRVGTANVDVLSNGYEEPAQPAGDPARDVAATGGVVTMIGLMTYEPNVDAARLLVEDVLPRLRAVRPDAEVRLVGRADDEVRALARDGVTVTGEVPEVAPELARADVVVVPIRFGGGTRIKILEAFAHGIPVVSTTFGCEGLDVTDGEHLLVADTPEAIAAACLALFADPERRVAITKEARERYEERYRWAPVRDQVAALARDVTGAVR